MGDIDTFGITLPVSDWQRLFALAQKVDRTPSDFLRLLIRREADKANTAGAAKEAAKEKEREQ